MDSRRAETFEALSAYLQQQRSFLARTQADIDRLKKLKAEILASPEQLVNRSSLQGNETAIPQLLTSGEKISHLQDYHPALSFPPKVDWEVFSTSDATPLRSLAVRTRIEHTQRTVPSNHQRSPLSFLQKFVKDSRKIILDPVFDGLSGSNDIIALPYPEDPSNPTHTTSSSSGNNIFPIPSLPSSLSEDEAEDHPQTPVVQESMTAQRKRERARAKVRELKKRKIKSDLVVGCKLGEEGSHGVFVRHDIEDESGDVDVSMETPKSCGTVPLDGPSEHTSDAMDVDTPQTVTPLTFPESAKPANLSRARQRTLSRAGSVNRSSRSRKPSLKLQAQNPISVPEQPTELSLTPHTPMSPQMLGKRSRETADINNTARKLKTERLFTSAETNAETDKNRSDTYKQAWTISEQHLLERLLEDIPDGERNRWAKISQAMGGRRTPRQVASRVQKYFEKLKRFGVGVDKKGKMK